MSYLPMPPANFSGLHYLAQGYRLVSRPGIKRFVILPLLVNILLFGGFFWWIFNHMGDWIATMMSHVPYWLQWLSYLIWPVALLSVLLVSSFLFSTLANLIASPFNGLLAEQAEAHLTGKKPPETSVVALAKDIPRILLREGAKFAYYLPRALVLLLLYLIPGLGQTLAPIIWFLFSAWMMAVQYNDYPFDNHKVSFRLMRQALKQHRGCQIQFGALVSLFTLIPLLNLVIMPIAVCGATAIWVDRYREQYANQ